MRALGVATLGITAAYGAAFLPGGAPRWAAWLLALSIAGCLVALMALGAARPGRGLGRLGPVLALVFVLIAGGFLLALALPAERVGDALWGGLPRRAAILLYGIGLIPLLVLPVAYAATFDEQTLSEDDLKRVRAAVRRLREEGEGGAAGTARVAGPGAPPRIQDTAGSAREHHPDAAARTESTRSDGGAS